MNTQDLIAEIRAHSDCLGKTYTILDSINGIHAHPTVKTAIYESAVASVMDMRMSLLKLATLIEKDAQADVDDHASFEIRATRQDAHDLSYEIECMKNRLDSLEGRN